MKYTIAKMFQILRHNRWVSILMIIEIALGMSVFTYSLNMFFSLSREKENQKNQERDLVLEISGGEGMNDIEKQAFPIIITAPIQTLLYNAVLATLLAASLSPRPKSLDK